MAKNGKGGGPGTDVRGGVRSTMASPFSKGSNMGDQRDMAGTFDRGRSGGGNGLPTTVTDRMGGMAAGPKPGFAASSPSSQGPNRTGTKQNRY